MAEKPKRVTQRIVRGEDGRVKILYIDLDTLQYVDDPFSQGYKVVTANTPIENVISIDEEDPQPNPENPVVTDPAEEAAIKESVQSAEGMRGSNSPTYSSPNISQSVNTNTGSGIRTPGTSSRNTSRSVTGQQTPAQSVQNQAVSRSSTSNQNQGVGFVGNFTGKHRSETPQQGFIDSITGAVENTRGLGSGYSVRGESGKDPSGMSYSGSGRHEHGVGMDFDVVDPSGKTVTDNRMQDLAAQYAYDNPNAGIGYGAGYMSPGRMHLDQSGLGGQWGAKGQSANMSPALSQTIDAARQGNLPTPFDNPGIPYSRDENPPSGYTSPEATGAPREGLQGLAASAIDSMGNQRAGTAAMEAQRSGISPTVTRSSPGVTVTDDGYTTTTRESIGGWRNNNPGNLKNTDFSKDKGSIGQDYRGFAVFGTLEQGQKAMSDLLFSAPAYSGMTIDQAINRYAPPEDDNNTKGYISAISQALGLPANTKLSDLSPSQRNTMIDTMTRFESGPNTVTEKSSMHTYSGPPSTGNMDSPSERSGGRFGGRGLGVADYDGSSYSGQNRGYDSPSEGNRSSFGGTTSGYSGRDGSRDSPSEGGGRFGGSGLGSTDTGKSGASDKGTSSYGGAKSSGDAQSSGKSGGKSSGGGFSSGRTSGKTDDN